MLLHDGRNVAARQAVHGSAPCTRTEVTGCWLGTVHWPANASSGVATLDGRSTSSDDKLTEPLREVAKYLKVKDRTIYRLVAKREGFQVLRLVVPGGSGKARSTSGQQGTRSGRMT